MAALTWKERAELERLREEVEEWAAVAAVNVSLKRKLCEVFDLEFSAMNVLDLPGHAQRICEELESAEAELRRYEDSQPTWAELSNLQDENDRLREQLAVAVRELDRQASNWGDRYSAQRACDKLRELGVDVSKLCVEPGTG